MRELRVGSAGLVLAALVLVVLLVQTEAVKKVPGSSGAAEKLLVRTGITAAVLIAGAAKLLTRKNAESGSAKTRARRAHGVHKTDAAQDVDMIGRTVRGGFEGAVQQMAALAKAVEDDDLESATEYADELLAQVVQLKAALGERRHMQENAEGTLAILQAYNRVEDGAERSKSILLFPKDERMDIIEKMPRAVRYALVEMPGGLPNADADFLQHAAMGCRRYLISTGNTVLDLCAVSYGPAMQWFHAYCQSSEFQGLLTHLLLRSTGGRTDPGRENREAQHIIAARLCICRYYIDCISANRFVCVISYRPRTNLNTYCRFSGFGNRDN